MLEQLILPPGGPLVVIALGLMLWTRRPRLARSLAVFGALALYSVSTPLVASLSMGSLVNDARALRTPAEGAGAIVVLGADIVFDAPEYDGDTLGPLSLERLRYGASVHRATGLPLLVTGGRVRHSTPVGEVMAASLKRDFGLSATWTESRSHTTRANAALSAPMLSDAGVDHIVLVTHAWHMPRAQWCFEREGFAVTPAGTGFFNSPPTWPGALVPTSRALRHTSLALHELLGGVWYRLRE